MSKILWCRRHPALGRPLRAVPAAETAGPQPGNLQTSADLALYAAKRDGRNGYRRFAPEMKDCGDTAAA
jgi:hypothetical protein